MKTKNSLQITSTRSLYLKWKVLLHRIGPTAIGPEILKTEVNSMNSFTELSMRQFRDLISALSNSTSPLDIIPTHLVKSFSDYDFLDLLKLFNLSLKAGCFPRSFKMAIVRRHLKKANSDNEDF